MSHKYHRLTLFVALPVIAMLIVTSVSVAYATEPASQSTFTECLVEFHNRDVKLAGSLLVPKSESPLPAVVFVHGAGHHTRESVREVAQHFANSGIAALIYDKRGVGQSGGEYESFRPYENLVNDALSAVALLKQRPEIAESQIGIWGLSQGAYISAAAASRTKDIKYIVTAGASVADGMMFYYRDNLFRLYGLSDTLRDVAEKAHMAKFSLPHNLPDGFGTSAFVSRSYPPPEQYLHPAWSQVDQPVLAMWGQLDQHVPVGESVAGLKNSLAHARNEKWTFHILPKANHDLGASDTGATQSNWRGYAPGALETMTDWVHRVVDDPSQVQTGRQEGFAPESGVVSKLARYERLRWFGNGVVQAALWIVFFLGFFAGTITGARHWLPRLLHGQKDANLQASQWGVNFRHALCAFNLLVLSALTYTVFSVLHQWRPSCPPPLLFLPILGTVSALATVFLLIGLVKNRSDDWAGARSIRGSFELLCLILFIPFMLYWNLIGYQF